ncbi:DUF1360 domain-containing protein [Cytobacillus sp. IB215316]|uniref:DUF1360 domain-containing protein n=1 Tax=Cytobacillus sp. IB215316 TaxID=3097354 RepID=UPI002A11570D|nr:DUF1360 domain-containing protein [Cytobacillus sp. IB215316]MDX8362525.1 DUF1360 domain-containing protein [Cytobacillus sp. IB215316]
MLTVFEFVILFLASFRLTRLIIYDTITAFLRKPFHEVIEEEQPNGAIVTYMQVKGTGLRAWIGELLSCYWCSGIWCTTFFYVGYLFWPFLFKPLIFIFAIAGCAAIIEVIISRLLE